MDAISIKKLLEKQIGELEVAVFTFENVLKPRMDADVKILERLRSQHLKLLVLIEKQKNGEPVSSDDVADCVPAVFR